MSTGVHEVAAKVLHKGIDDLTDRERRVIERFIERGRVSRNTNREFSEQSTLGQRVADRVAAYGGSWAFIGWFAGTLIVWILLNVVVLARRDAAFDPYPFILLNLLLSMLAAIQAPVILMSQNRQAAKDRLDAAQDYEVNLKAELEILTLHEKLDALREGQWGELIRLQEEEIAFLRELLSERGAGGEGDGST
jgi:uncharacterized membrane protein